MSLPPPMQTVAPDVEAVELPESPATVLVFDDRYRGRMTLLVALSCMVATIGGVIFGYDVGISGGVMSMEPFLKEFFPAVYARMKEITEEETAMDNYCRFESPLLTTFTSSLYVVGFFASFFASWITRGYGHRATMVAGGATYFTGAVLGGAALNVWMLLAGRMLLGVGVGFTNQAVPLYLSEMAPPQYRGAVSNGFHLSIVLGFILANLVNYGTHKMDSSQGWRISLASGAAPALCFTVGAAFLLETPINVLHREGDIHKAAGMLQRLRGTAEVITELNDMASAALIATTATVGYPLRQIIRRRHRPHLATAVCIQLFHHVTGYNLVVLYAPVLYRTTGLGESVHVVSAMVVGVVGVVATLVSMATVDRVGRRMLFMVGGAQMVATQLAIGGLMALQLGERGDMVVLVLTCIYVAGFNASWGPLGWLIPSEIFRVEIRSSGQSIAVAIGFLCAAVVAQTSLGLMCMLKFGVFFFFGGWVTLMTAFVYLLLPETKNQPIEQMESVWKEHWFWGRVVGDERTRGEHVGHVI